MESALAGVVGLGDEDVSSVKAAALTVEAGQEHPGARAAHVDVTVLQRPGLGLTHDGHGD